MTIEQAFATVKNSDFTNADRDRMCVIKAKIMIADSAVQLAQTAIQEVSKAGPAATPEASANILMDTLMTMITLAFIAGQIWAQPAPALDPPPGAKVRVN